MTALAPTHHFPEAAPVEIVSYRVEAVTVAADHRDGKAWQILGYVVLRVTRGLRMNGNVAWVESEVIAGSAAAPLSAAEAQTALAGFKGQKP